YACTAGGVCTQSCGVKGNGQTVLAGSDGGSMTSPGGIQQAQIARRYILERGDQIQQKKREGREKPSAQTYILYRLCTHGRARAKYNGTLDQVFVRYPQRPRATSE